ncbi:MAG: NADP-dependent oxidoreductase [Glycomyces artemisiae]|uniref:NADP-dependent oxidoreductase n=1 Tax=Glycomyces artemisiae TaxID=1076443 RepID=A0A850C6U2_9ACTN|nr:NADP-dependent oxidoreductase [Glycomyces artemisiae]
MTYGISTQARLVRRPAGLPSPDDFEIVTEPLPDLRPDEVRVVNDFVSVDPYMRGRMRDAPSYIPPFKLHETMTGDAVGRVVESRSTELKVGDLVTHDLGWRDVAQADEKLFRKVEPLPGLSTSLYLGPLGTTGFTAYVGLVRIAELREGDTVFVSGAAGAVGSIAGQIARIKGAARVIGSAGTPEKVAALTERFGFDAGFDYHVPDLAQRLAELTPDGLDVYFDNVGGPQLEAAVAAMRDFGRAAVCGSIADYNLQDGVPGPRNLGTLVSRRLTLRGFLITDHRDLHAAFRAEMTGWLADGRIVTAETVIDGIERAPEAFLGLFTGHNTGKMLVRPRQPRVA